MVGWVLGGVAAAAALLLAAFTLSFRTGFRPVLDVVRRFNRSVTNPRQLPGAGLPGASTSVVHHVGRTTGTEYATPVVAVPTADGYLFALPYGPGADWVRNVRAAGTATVQHDGRALRVDHPELVPAADADPHFDAAEQRMHRIFGVDDFLRVRRSAAQPTTQPTTQPATSAKG